LFDRSKIVGAIWFLILSMSLLSPVVSVDLPPDYCTEDIPGYFETSEYMYGSTAVLVVFLESNGSIMEQSQNWTTAEKQNIASEVEWTCDWIAAQESRANISFLQVYYDVDTGYEPIDLPGNNIHLWIGDAMTSLGHSGKDWIDQVRNFVNQERFDLGTDWVVVLFVIDSSDDEDGRFPDGRYAFNDPGGPLICMTSTLAFNDPDSFGIVFAEELANVFWATDENVGKVYYSGYLNASNTPLSGCLMHNHTWCLSEGTRQQLGWNDTDGDNLLDIVDTEPVASIISAEITGNTLNLSGTASVTAYPNRNPHSNSYPIVRNVTIKEIETVMFRIDEGNWTNAEIMPTTVKMLIKWPDTYIEKPTKATVNFTMVADSLNVGNHSVEIKVIDDWGNYAFINTTIEIPEFLSTDLNKDWKVNIQDITIVAIAYKSRPGDPNWNSLADIDKNGVIDILDITKVAVDYGKTI
jgi:archaellin